MSTMDNSQPDDVRAIASEPATAPSATQGSTPLRRGARVAAPIVAALLVGGAVVYAVDHGSGASTTSAGTSAVFAGPQASGGAGGAAGPVAGEEHIQGTVTAKTSSTVTVKSSGGTATYTVNATTEIVRNGQTATLADIKVNDPVLVHVFPSASGRMLVERLLAGISASNTGTGGFGPPAVGGTTIPGGSAA